MRWVSASAQELGIPGYFYEEAALHPRAAQLGPYCRKGEYEGLEKLADPAMEAGLRPCRIQ